MVLLPQYPFCESKQPVGTLNWQQPFMKVHIPDGHYRATRKCKSLIWLPNSLMITVSPASQHLYAIYTPWIKPLRHLLKLCSFSLSWPIWSQPRNLKVLYTWILIKEVPQVLSLSLLAPCRDLSKWHLVVPPLPPLRPASNRFLYFNFSCGLLLNCGSPSSNLYSS